MEILVPLSVSKDVEWRAPIMREGANQIEEMGRTFSHTRTGLGGSDEHRVCVNAFPLDYLKNNRRLPLVDLVGLGWRFEKTGLWQGVRVWVLHLKVPQSLPRLQPFCFSSKAGDPAIPSTASAIQAAAWCRRKGSGNTVDR